METNRVARRLRRLSTALAAALAFVGCGIPQAVGDECGGERSAYEAISRRKAGMDRRGLDQTSPYYRITLERLARARAVVAECAEHAEAS